MDVTVESTSGLGRKLRVQIPEDRIQGEVDKRLQNMAQSVRLPGFRPGKVPRKVIAQRFGRQVRDEVVGEVVQTSFFEAVNSEDLKLASPPTIDPLDSAPGEGLAYTATFDVLPEIVLPPLESMEIARPVAAVNEGDVDRMVETLRAQRKTWHEADREAKPGDRVVADFEGTCGDELVEGAKGSEVPIEIGAGRMIPGFEAGLEGAKAGEERTLDLTFPEAYHAERLAGQAVKFQVKVHRVEESALPEVDDEFVRGFGVEDGGIEQLRSDVRENMERELADAVGATLKERVMDALLVGDDIELPASMVEEESRRAAEMRREELRQAGLDPESLGLEQSMFDEAARKRVALGLLVGELIKSNGIKPDPERVRKRIETIASTYQEPAEVINWYYSDRERLGGIESTVLEDQVVEWVLERANVVDTPSSFDALLNPGQTSSGGAS